MNWKYYIPHLWEHDRQVWEDVYLLPDVDKYEGDAIWLTIDALGYYEGKERRAAEERLGDASYQIDGADMLVHAEDFSEPELLEWVRVWLEQQDLAVTELVASDYTAFRGHVPNLDAAHTALAEMRSETADEVQIDPDTFAAILPDVETAHKYKIVMPRQLFEQIEAMDEYEAEELMRAIASLADNPTPPGARRLPGSNDDPE